MNSLTCHDDYDLRKCITDNNRCYQKPECCHKEPSKVILGCGTGGAGPLPIIAIGDLTAPIPVVSTTLDMANLCTPQTRLVFTSQINIPVAAAVTLNFNVFKSCDGGTPQQIGSTFTFSLAVGVVESTSFSFQLCDVGCCQKCCTYSVELAPTTITADAGVTITNATLTALAVESCN
ncbi:DUF4489 domain-containing protein [Clostridium fermenticellae]|uniref:DUF4489 domain-containing protein n=1 Tax=Clostridium fermenticellae TaxID=2068654 RepID=A0A386H541_9CLOT|nr:DUF4489 domain-containing protein [Clostridium fermenticellae]AYD40829.1 DUF4489 domain-containing protein [Clostridium fermenticellae]